jgi:hypothetical protein
MNRNRGRGGSPRGGMFGIAVLATVGIGVALAVPGILRLRAPAPVVIKPPPEVRVVEKPPPPPKVIIKGVPAPAPAPPPPPVAPPPPPPPPEAVLEAKPVRDGVWRGKEHPLPMVQLRLSGESVAGTLAPDWSAVLPFCDGKVAGDAVEVAVDNGVFRTHFRMSLVDDGRAKLEAWVTDEDWMASLARANKLARPPRQAVVARRKLEHNARRLRKPKAVGTFLRGAG